MVKYVWDWHWVEAADGKRVVRLCRKLGKGSYGESSWKDPVARTIGLLSESCHPPQLPGGIESADAEWAGGPRAGGEVFEANQKWES